jgi:hypothetical protein
MAIFPDSIYYFFPKPASDSRININPSIFARICIQLLPCCINPMVYLEGFDYSQPESKNI